MYLGSNRAAKRELAQREEERKRDVFKTAAVELARLPKHINSLTRLSEGKPANSDELLGMSAALTQITQVSSSETAKIALKLSGQINNIALKAVNELSRMNDLQAKSSAIGTRLEQLKAANAHNQYGASESTGNTTKASEIIELEIEQYRLAIEVSKESIAYLKWCRTNLREPLKNCFELTVSIRNEYGITGDEDQLRHIYEMDRVNFDRELDTFLAKQRKNLENQEAALATVQGQV